jgi:hypothetical protein
MWNQSGPISAALLRFILGFRLVSLAKEKTPASTSLYSPPLFSVPIMVGILRDTDKLPREGGSTSPKPKADLQDVLKKLVLKDEDLDDVVLPREEFVNLREVACTCWMAMVKVHTTKHYRNQPFFLEDGLCMGFCMRSEGVSCMDEVINVVPVKVTTQMNDQLLKPVT